jgi:RimJ/RimL family protein N-acetyltransferase
MSETLEGLRIVLRSPRPTDRADRVAAGRDLEFHRMVGGSRSNTDPLTPADVDRWYTSLVAERFAWVVEFESRCVGAARLHHVDLSDGVGQYAVGLFRPEHRGKGLGQEVTKLVLHYGFETLRLQRVQLKVLDFNAPAIACYRKCGFVEVGREPVQLADEAAVDVLMEIRRPVHD